MASWTAESARKGTRASQRHVLLRERHVLARYRDRHGAQREVLSVKGARASVLVIDRDLASLGDRRLVAHLDADEPLENARIVCAEYIANMGHAQPRCRALRTEDLDLVPTASACERGTFERVDPAVAAALASGDVRGFRLRAVGSTGSLAQLRWCACLGPVQAHPVSLRDGIASLESYEPLRSMTVSALAPERQRRGVSTTVLRAELKRVLESPIVLNKALREAVLARVESGKLSLSEIAMRCGRVKRDAAGNESGETSWLGRRLGLLPEGGKASPTPWIHSDVLGLIARSGIGIAPREVEL